MTIEELEIALIDKHKKAKKNIYEGKEFTSFPGDR
jgi:hypothetical protein